MPLSTQTTEANTDSSRREKPIPYAPSWVDYFTAWLERLPGRNWIHYLVLGLVLLAFQSTVLWIEGAYAIGTFLPIQAFLAGAVPFFLALFNYLDARAAAALESMRPALKATEEECDELHYQLTTLPRWSTLLAGVIIIVIVTLSELVGGAFYPEDLVGFPISSNLFRVLYYILWWLLGTYLYHALHQLRLIDLIYTGQARINLFRAKPFYAFSVLSALTAGSLGMIIYGWLLVNPTINLNDPLVLAWVILILLSALVAFLWPQLGMHRLQVLEQERLLDEAYLRLEVILSELHRRLDNGEYGLIGDVNSAITSLEMEVKAIKGIRTWPWEPETLQILVTALAFPLGLWLIQLILGRLLGS